MPSYLRMAKGRSRRTALKVGILGLGRLGTAILGGLKKSKAFKFELSASVRNLNKSRRLQNQFKIPVHIDNRKVAQWAEVLILAVKPKQAEKVLKNLRPHLKSNQLLVSVCASITHAQLKSWAGSKIKIIRAMPNLPGLIGEGVTVLTPSSHVSQESMSLVTEIFKSLGETLILEESAFDAVTALSACGPAFIFTIIESLIEAGVKVGVSREDSRVLVIRTLIGSGLMLEKTGKHPAELKDQVTTPAGCTIDGLQALEEGRLRATLLKAIVASTKRASQLRQR